MTKYHYYVHSMVTTTPLTEKEQIKLLDAVNIKKLATSGLRPISHKKWERMFEVLNK